jgi:hypothetical protein
MLAQKSHGTLEKKESSKFASSRELNSSIRNSIIPKSRDLSQRTQREMGHGLTQMITDKCAQEAPCDGAPNAQSIGRGGAEK